MTHLTIHIQGAEDMAGRLDRFGREFNDFHETMTEIGSFVSRFASGEVFVSRGGAIGQPWAPLNAAYAIEKAKRWAGRPPLVRTGRMQRSFVSDAGRMSVEITNNDPKFRYHQLGTAHIPARVMLAIDETQANRIEALFEADIRQKMRDANV